MNFYDKVHELVRCFKETDEYKTYMNLKEKIKKDEKYSKMLKEFKEKQTKMQNGTAYDKIHVHRLCRYFYRFK